MKNIDYVLENFIKDNALTREELAEGMCPKIFDNSLEEIDCENTGGNMCGRCWELEVTI